MRWIVLHTDRSDSRHGDLSPSPGTEPLSRVSVVNEADDYTRSVRGIDIEAIRTGPGIVPTEIRSVVSQDYVASSLKIGFPVFSRTTLPDDTIGVATILSTPPGALWCGINLSAGDFLIYGRGAEHLAVNPVGMRFAFATMRGETLEGVADDLELGITVPTGVCKVMTPSAETHRLSETLRGATGESAASNDQTVIGSAGLLDDVCRTLATEAFENTGGSTRIDNRGIVLACIEYAESVGRRPTIEEMCKVSFVSERRLRYAFTLTHGLGPCQFFLRWALDLSRRRLLGADPTVDTVSRIAAECGLPHLGRFARRYKRYFGESPSTTLMR